MDIRTVTPRYSVTPQIAPEDIGAIKAAGFTKVICNRPDAEDPPALQAARIEEAATAAGLDFVYNPVNGAAMTLDNVEEQAEAMAAAEGKTVAYCASGMRSAVIWAFAQAGQQDTDAIIAAGNAAGYPMDGLRAQIEALAARG